MTASRRRSPILLAGCAILLAGCATDDPRKGGLLGGLIGLGSGTYEARVADEQAALEAEETRYQAALADRDQLGESLADRRGAANVLQREIIALRQEIDALDAEIATLQHEEGLARSEVEHAEADVALLLDDIDRIEAAREALERAQALGADAGEDADPAEFGEPPREQVSDLRAYIGRLQAAVDALKAARDLRADEGATPPGDAAD